MSNFTRPTDRRGNEFDPWAGSSEPQEGRCRAHLTDWRYRYGTVRYCTGLPENTFVEDGSDRCRMHTNRDGLKMRTNELFQNGLEAKSVFHFYDKVHPTKKALALLWYEDLLEQSVYDFEWNLETISIDFSTVDNSGDNGESTLPTPPSANGRVELDIPFATKHKDAATSLLLAAASKLKMLDVDSTLMMMGMERDVYEDTELDYESGEWNTLSGKDEHHLNLPMDRLIRTHGDLLEYGGVGVEDERDVSNDAPDTLIEVYDSPDAQDPIPPEQLNDEGSLDIPVQ